MKLKNIQICQIYKQFTIHAQVFVKNIKFSYIFRNHLFSTNFSDHYVWSGPPKNHEVEEWMNAYSDYTVQINDGNICGTATCLKNNDIKKLYKWMIFHIMSYETLIYILIIFERFGKIMTSSISVVSLFLVRAFSKITFCPTFQSQKSAQFFS